MTRVRSPRNSWARIHNHQHPPQSIHAQRDETPFAGRIRVFDREGHVIAKRLLGMRKAHAMFTKITASFGRVELELHFTIMHIRCILSGNGVPAQRRTPGASITHLTLLAIDDSKALANDRH